MSVDSIEGPAYTLRKDYFIEKYQTFAIEKNILIIRKESHVDREQQDVHE